ncbi:hypothetical protein JG688_00004079 [Phytophthora aleatoria]|uniref:Uncharacterized protein n=1 Tax=Phytophthora aleatoria TaxID=2496075 RepID=A0A8J5J2A9_9STRA|nr:hypothetical protein JG688_00004079 [Phytophthora aleatoria]
MPVPRQRVHSSRGFARRHQRGTPWLKWVVNGNLPLTIVEMESTRARPVSTKTLRENMESLTEVVEGGSVRKEMSDKFGLMLDGWTHRSEHYLAVFGC